MTSKQEKKLLDHCSVPNVRPQQYTKMQQQGLHISRLPAPIESIPQQLLLDIKVSLICLLQSDLITSPVVREIRSWKTRNGKDRFLHIISVFPVMSLYLRVRLFIYLCFRSMVFVLYLLLSLSLIF